MRALTTSTTPRRRRLAATLTTTLRTKAAQATESLETRPPGRFDPARRPSPSPLSGLVDLDGQWSGSSRTSGSEEWVPLQAPVPPRPRRRLVAAAALVVAAALVGAVGAVRVVVSDGDDGMARTSDTTVPAGPEGWLVPTWVPEGMEVWNVQWSDGSHQPGADTSWGTFQLFGDPDAGRAIYVQAGQEYEESTADAEPIRIRGQSGWAGPAIDIEIHTDERIDSIFWNEAGATITALFRGMTAAEAVAAVEAMEWRSGTPEGGFAPPADGSLPLRGESLSSEGTVGASFFYSEGVPATDGLSLSIVTSTEPSTPIGYLDEWFYRGDQVPPADDGARHEFDSESHELRVSWPDGRTVLVSPGLPTSDDRLPGRDVLERIVDSLVVGTEADLAPLRDRFESNVEALPVLASAETSAGSLELHGVGSGRADFQRLCLRRPDQPGLDCGQGPGIAGDLVASWDVAGVWYVGVAATGYEPEVLGRAADDESAGEALPGEDRSDGEWNLLLVQPPADVAYVHIDTDAAGTSQIGLPRRP